ncbi:MAG: hypothetical protein ABL982_21115, partial [Vicinamibacterales bacterium]
MREVGVDVRRVGIGDRGAGAGEARAEHGAVLQVELARVLRRDDVAELLVHRIDELEIEGREDLV